MYLSFRTTDVLAIIGSLGFYFYSLPVSAALPANEKQDIINQAVTQALVTDFIALFASLMTVVVALMTGFGYLCYRKISEAIEGDIKIKVEEGESRSLIRLSLRDFEKYEEVRNACGDPKLNSDHKILARACLLSAISHAQQSWYCADRIKKPLTYTPKIALYALAGANLAYFYAELLGLLDSDNEKADCIKKLKDCITTSAPYIYAVCRTEEAIECSWWAVKDSLLYAEYTLLCQEPHSDQIAAKKADIYQEIHKMIGQYEIPLKSREQIEKDWADRME